MVSWEIPEKCVLEMYWVHYFFGFLQNKGYRIWLRNHRTVYGKYSGQIDRYCFGKTYLLKVSCHLYYLHNYSLCH